MWDLEVGALASLVDGHVWTETATARAAGGRTLRAVGAPPGARPHRGVELAGRFLLLRTVAAGRGATVFGAVDLEVREPVAVKLLLSGAVPAERRAAFRGAAARMRSLEHPAVVPLLAEGALRGGHLYQAFAWAAHGDLRAAWRRGAASATGTAGLQCLAEAASALASVHRRSLVHADLTPANVLVPAAGRAWLADWECARPEGSPPPTLGEGAGTPGHRAPEQGAKAPLRAASDVFAFGTILRAGLEARRIGAPGRSSRLGALSAACLRSRPAERPSAASLAGALHAAARSEVARGTRPAASATCAQGGPARAGAYTASATYPPGDFS